MSHKNKKGEPSQPVQFNIDQKNTYRKCLDWLHFNKESRVQEKKQVKDQQSYIFFSVAYLTYATYNWKLQSRHDDSIQCRALSQIYRNKTQPQKKETTLNESMLQFS